MTTHSGSITSFGVFEVERRSGELRKGGVRVRLAAQPFQLLIVLLDRAGEVVTREELQRHVWPADTFVDFDRGLNKAVNRLREAFGDTADSPRFIETLPKRGYRFIAPVQNDAAASRVIHVPVPTEAFVLRSADGFGDGASESLSVERERPRWRRHAWLGGAALVLLGIAAAGYAVLPGPTGRSTNQRGSCSRTSTIARVIRGSTIRSRRLWPSTFSSPRSSKSCPTTK